MGSAGRRRRRPTRAIDGDPARDFPRSVGFPVFRHGAYTPEGGAERWSAFSAGMSRLRGPTRWLVVAVRLLALGAVLYGVLQLVAVLAD